MKIKNKKIIKIASVARRVYMRCPTGVGALSRRYGGKNRRNGVRRSHTVRGARKVIRYSMQTFEKLGWMRKAEYGRKLTKRGHLFLDEFSDGCKKSTWVNKYWKRSNIAEIQGTKI